MEPAITTQPKRSAENSEKATEANGDPYLKEMTEKSVKEDLTEVTAVFDGPGHIEEMTEEEKEKRRQSETDCCCVYTPYYTDDSDVFCMYILCDWICDCFRGIGVCTDSCFDGCANCLSDCCEGDACCTSDGGSDGCCDGCGDCFSACADCCGSCDCDCSS